MDHDQEKLLRARIAELEKENAGLRELKAENELLHKQLVDCRAQRAEYMKYITELLPPMDLPSEEEMREQMKNLVSADLVLRDLDEIIATGAK